MRQRVFQGLTSMALCCMLLAGTLSGHAQSVPIAAPPDPVPSGPKSPPKPTQSEEHPWDADGATAQCRDGTFFHGPFDRRTCVDHGGVSKVFQGRGQDLIR